MAADRSRQERWLDTPFNSPSEVEASPNTSGRSPDLRLNELERPSQDFRPSGFIQIAKLSALTVTR